MPGIYRTINDDDIEVVRLDSLDSCLVAPLPFLGAWEPSGRTIDGVEASHLFR